MKMKQLVLVVAMALVTSTAFAGSGTNVDTSQQQQQAAISGANASNTGNAQTINFNAPSQVTEDLNVSGTTTSNVNYSGTQTIKNTPNATGPNLTSSNDTCMGSSSGGVSVPGFGFSLGSTWTDKNCVMLKNSREMWNMGMKAAAMARLCMDADNKEALQETGFTCPTKK